MYNTNRTLDDIIESVYELSHNVVKYASLYYTYYTLNFKGIKDFDYEFRTLENRLYEDFYYLYLFFIMQEVIVFEESGQGSWGFQVRDGTNSDPHAVDFLLGDEKTLNEDVINAIIKCTGCDPEFIWNIVELNVNYPKNMKKDLFNFLTEDELKSRFHYIENKFGWLSNSREFLAQMKKLVDVEHRSEDNGSNYICDGFSNSDINSSIIHFLTETVNESKTTFVDIAWSISHHDFLILEFIGSDDLLPVLLHEVMFDNYANVYDIAKLADTRLDRFLYKSILIGEQSNAK